MVQLEEKNNNQTIKMSPLSTSQNVLIRLSIVLGMAAAVLTVIYFTPMPRKFFNTILTENNIGFSLILGSLYLI